MQANPVVRADGPVLIFGGPYSNLQATEAVLAEAKRLGIPPERTICTGDLAAYCGEPAETVDCVRTSGVHVLMGNCDEQLAADSDSCDCGLPAGGSCDRLSSIWFTFAKSEVGDAQRAWLAGLPRCIELEIGGARLAIVHGSPSQINSFVFATTARELKRAELEAAGCDGIIGGHCGLPFTEVVDNRLWHNPGAVGIPANDGTARVWFSVLRPRGAALVIEHHPLDYDHAAAANAMLRAGLPPEYRLALASGLWPSCDVLPERERALQGVPLEPGSVLWKPGSRGRKLTAGRSQSELLWPAILAREKVPWMLMAPTGSR